MLRIDAWEMGVEFPFSHEDLMEDIATGNMRTKCLANIGRRMTVPWEAFAGAVATFCQNMGKAPGYLSGDVDRSAWEIYETLHLLATTVMANMGSFDLMGFCEMPPINNKCPCWKRVEGFYKTLAHSEGLEFGCVNSSDNCESTVVFWRKVN